MTGKKVFDPKANLLRIRKIIKVTSYGSNCSTLFFEDEFVSDAIPGQYLMIWVIGCDEVPLSVSHVAGGMCGITVKAVGDTTNRLCAIAESQSLGVRGPFGEGYEIIGKKPLLAAGGIGVAGIHLLVDKMLQKKMFPTVVVGTRTGSENIFHKEFENLKKRGLLSYFPASDDGSIGQKCFASEIVEQLTRETAFDHIYGCGPEKMLYDLFDISFKKDIGIQLSLERYMKCAIGICGQCALDDSGLLVCRDGPVFSRDDLLRSSDFGKYTRSASGIKLPI
jgi:dihydroorotate dehydrogenase electron transfer subunit